MFVFSMLVLFFLRRVLNLGSMFSVSPPPIEDDPEDNTAETIVEALQIDPDVPEASVQARSSTVLEPVREAVAARASPRMGAEVEVVNFTE